MSVSVTRSWLWSCAYMTDLSFLELWPAPGCQLSQLLLLTMSEGLDCTPCLHRAPGLPGASLCSLVLGLCPAPLRPSCLSVQSPPLPATHPLCVCLPRRYKFWSSTLTSIKGYQFYLPERSLSKHMHLSFVGKCCSPSS